MHEPSPQTTPDEKARGTRARRILVGVMVAFILIPLVAGLVRDRIRAAQHTGLQLAAAQTTLPADFESKLAGLGLTLPPPPAAIGAYVPSVRTGNLLFIAGTLPLVDGKVSHSGKVTADPEGIRHGYDAARQCALNSLANIKAALGSLDRVSRIVSVTGFVNGTDNFPDSPKVINGASELFLAVFGDAGRHARAAVSVNGLPLKASVEITVIVEVRE
ncbi:MAG: RidA family protein [Puniceicoccales bacterium]|nr:RidA family protein [Puniceicoccales bacterium]